MRILKKIIHKIKILLLFIKIKKSRNIILKGKVVFCNTPLFDVHAGSNLIIGKNVTINSENKGYHLNMYGKCKILIDRPGAKVEIGDNTRFHGSCIHAFKEIIIGKNCLIAANCQIIDGNGHDLSFPDVENRINTQGPVKPVYIEDDVWLGTNVVVLPGVRIGRGSVISANSVVHKDIPSMVIAGGNPIIIIKDMKGV